MSETTNGNPTPKEQQIQQFVAQHMHKDAEGKTLIIRTGNAPKLLDDIAPSPVRLSGTIDAPAEFYKKRKGLTDPNRCHVVYDKLKGTIKLVIDEQYESKNFIIEGSVIENPDLLAFKINRGQNSYWQPKELHEFLKLNRAYFSDREAHAKILASLQNFKAKIQHEIEDVNNNRGNDTQVRITTLENQFAENFVLNIGIYKGKAKSTFRVDVCCRVRDRNVEFWFESVELKEIQMTAIDTLMEEQLKTFEGIVCIEI
jgi:hypothetical protein